MVLHCAVYVYCIGYLGNVAIVKVLIKAGGNIYQWMVMPTSGFNNAALMLETTHAANAAFKLVDMKEVDAVGSALNGGSRKV